MSNESKYTALTDELYSYIAANGTRPDPVLDALSRETEAMGDVAVMQTAADQGALLSLLTRAVGARRALEVGTFTGFGAISIARGLADDGTLITCELDEERAATAQRWFGEAGLEDRIDLRIGPAIETLRSLDGPFDFAYIDADKPCYPAYYEECLRLLRPGGMVAIDNVLFSGRVLDPGDNDSAAAIAALNRQIAADDRVDVAMLSIGDGLTLALKRPPR